MPVILATLSADLPLAALPNIFLVSIIATRYTHKSSAWIVAFRFFIDRQRLLYRLPSLSSSTLLSLLLLRTYILACEKLYQALPPQLYISAFSFGLLCSHVGGASIRILLRTLLTPCRRYIRLYSQAVHFSRNKD